MGLFNSKPDENKEKIYKDAEGMAENMAKMYYSGRHKIDDFSQDEHYNKAQELLRGNAKKRFLANEKFQDYFLGNHTPFIHKHIPDDIAPLKQTQRRSRKHQYHFEKQPVTRVNFKCRAKNCLCDKHRNDLTGLYSPYSCVSVESPGTLSVGSDSQGLETISILDNTPHGTRIKRHLDLRRKGDGHLCRKGCNCWEDKIRSEYRYPRDDYSPYSPSSQTSDDSGSTSGYKPVVQQPRPYLYPSAIRSQSNPSVPEPVQHKPNCETRVIERDGEKYTQTNCSGPINQNGIKGFFTRVELKRHQFGGLSNHTDELPQYPQDVNKYVRSDGFSDTSITEGNQFGGNYLYENRREDGFSDTSVTDGNQLGGHDFSATSVTDDIVRYVRGNNLDENRYGNQLGGNVSTTSESGLSNQLDNSSTDSEDNFEVGVDSNSDKNSGILLKNNRITSEELVRLQDMMFRSNTASEEYGSGSSSEENGNIYGNDSDDGENDDRVFKAFREVERNRGKGKDNLSTEGFVRHRGAKRNKKYQ